MSYRGHDDEYHCACSSCEPVNRSRRIFHGTIAAFLVLVLLATFGLLASGCATERRVLAFNAKQVGGTFGAYPTGDCFVRVLDAMTEDRPELRNQAVEVLDGVNVQWVEGGMSSIIDLPLPHQPGHIVVDVGTATYPCGTDLPVLLVVILHQGLGLNLSADELSAMVATARVRQ